MLHGRRRAPHHTTTQTFYFDFSVLLTSSYGKSRVLRRGRVGHESDKCVIVFDADANQEYNFIVHAPLQAKDALTSLVGSPQILAVRALLILEAELHIDLRILALRRLNELMSGCRLEEAPVLHKGRIVRH